MYVILVLVGIIILLQVLKGRWRSRARELRQRAQEQRFAEQQETRDRALLVALLYAINKGIK